MQYYIVFTSDYTIPSLFTHVLLLGLYEYLHGFLHNTLHPITCLITWFWLALHGLCPHLPPPPRGPPPPPTSTQAVPPSPSLPPPIRVSRCSKSQRHVRCCLAAATSIVEDPVTECRRSAGVHCCQRRGLGTSRGVLIAPVNGCPRHGSGPGWGPQKSHSDSGRMPLTPCRCSR